MSLLSKPRHPAYHLRPNKAVDRLLFMDILRALELYCPLNQHTYIGLGGPFLEDFRLVSQMFPSLRMISIESDKETNKRQQFHLCSRQMDVVHGEFGDFLSTGFPSDSPTITWADYTDLTRESLLEASDIARKAPPLSMIRVTVRAETPLYRELGIKYNRRPQTLPKSKAKEFERFVAKYREKMEIEGATFDASIFNWDAFKENNYPTLLTRLINSVLDASSTHPKKYLPLHAVKYSDGTIMLSVTGVFYDEQDEDQMMEHFAKHLDDFAADPNCVEEIDVPVLTTKERLLLESLLPVARPNGKITQKALGYLIEGDGSDDNSLNKMRQYEKYHRLYPYFGKVIP